MIFGQGYWQYLAVPILLSVVLGTLILIGGYLSAQMLVNWLETASPALAAQPDWVRGFLIVFLLLLVAGPSYVVFRSLILVLYGPFLDRLPENVENQVTGTYIDISSR